MQPQTYKRTSTNLLNPYQENPNSQEASLPNISGLQRSQPLRQSAIRRQVETVKGYVIFAFFALILLLCILLAYRVIKKEL